MEKKFKVGFWPFMGYSLCVYEVEATCEEETLDRAVVAMLDDCPACCLEVDEVDESEEEGGLYLYVDATMEGANRPVYVDAQNLKIIAA